jgi:3-hydroxyanthranilate 3,4-dioxygenase
MRWYCPNLAAHNSGPKLIKEVRFECHDLGTQLKPIIDGWIQDEAGRKCGGPDGCGQVAGARELPGGLRRPEEIRAQEGQ